MTARYSVIAFSGSPSTTSKTALLAEHVLGLVGCPGSPGRHYRVGAVEPRALLTGNVKDALLAEMVQAVEAAHGVIVATPIYKAAYSGLLKAFLDVLPQFALAGKAVLPVATGGSIAHVLALDYALRPVLQSMGARHIVQSHFVAEPDMSISDGRLTVGGSSAPALLFAAEHFRWAMTDDPSARQLGHPRPDV